MGVEAWAVLTAGGRLILYCLYRFLAPLMISVPAAAMNVSLGPKTVNTTRNSPWAARPSSTTAEAGQLCGVSGCTDVPRGCCGSLTVS